MTIPTESLPLLKVFLSAPDGAYAEMTLHGAHVISWIPVQGGEQIFLSRKSEYRPGVAIRGGIPVIFPQFDGHGTLPKHGFARTLPWELLSNEAGVAVLRLQDNPSTRSIWPFAFRAEYRVEVGGQDLATTLRVVNTGAAAFSFTAALHTYLHVEDVRQASVEGLKGLRYADSANGRNSEQFQLGDHRSLDEVVRDVAALGYTPSFCTACYRLGRTGADFMDMAKPGLIKHHCAPNALSSCMEYLIDYAKPETRKTGEGLITHELDTMESSVQKIGRRLVAEVKADKRDVFV